MNQILVHKCALFVYNIYVQCICICTYMHTCLCFSFRCVVWTGDGRVFFYNPSQRVSLWERPDDLQGRADVDKMVQTPPDAAGIDQILDSMS